MSWAGRSPDPENQIPDPETRSPEPGTLNPETRPRYELGGPQWSAKISACILFTFWVIYIVVSSLQVLGYLAHQKPALLGPYRRPTPRVIGGS